MRHRFGNIAPEKARTNSRSSDPNPSLSHPRVLIRQTEPPLPHSLFTPRVLSCSFRKRALLCVVDPTHPQWEEWLFSFPLSQALLPGSPVSLQKDRNSLGPVVLARLCLFLTLQPVSLKESLHPNTAKVTPNPRLTGLVGHPSEGPN